MPPPPSAKLLPTRAVRRAVLRVPTPEGRRWRWFEAPTAVLTAWEHEDVLPLLDRAEAAAHDGNWVVGFIAYDAAPAFDSALSALRDPTVPLAAFGVFRRALPSAGPAGGAYQLTDWTPTRTQEAYEAAVSQINELIAAGETYQVNYTMRLRAGFSGDPFGLFAALSRAQRADHLAFIDLGDAAVCSASPELFVHREGVAVSSRPMKGTRPRHPDPSIDSRLIDELVRSEKDRAENTMIVDMVRNDFGRVAEIGSVEVPALHRVETYPTVHQLISDVTARTDASFRDLMAATFPAASITGAPKVATTRIISDLEGDARGVYTGAVGVIAPGGDIDLNVAIRTAWIDRAANTATYGVGGGIVWDSDPAAEWHEAHDKARILQRANPDFRLFETIAWEPGTGATLFDRHLTRLRRSAGHFGFEIDIDEIGRVIDAVESPVALRLRLLLAPDGAIELQQHPISPTPARPLVALASAPVESSSEFLAHKTTNRRVYDVAKAAAPDAFDVILWNERGGVTETTIGNVVVEIEGERLTPPTNAGLLPGTFRAELLAAEAITEKSISLAMLEQADQVWMINSVRGWVAVDVDFSSATALLSVLATAT